VALNLAVPYELKSNPDLFRMTSRARAGGEDL